MTDNKDRYFSLVEAAPYPSGHGRNGRIAAEISGSESDQGACRRTMKKPYVKPTYRFERVFETMALSCGKVGPVEFQCRFNRKNS